MKNKLTLFVLLFVVVGFVQLANAGGPTGTWAGDLHSNNFGPNAGTFSNWAFYADGTTEGQWEIDASSHGTAVSVNAYGTYTFSKGKAIAKYTGTADLSGGEEGNDTSGYTMTVTLTFPDDGPLDSVGTYSIKFEDWPSEKGTWQGSRQSAPISEHVYFIELWQNRYHEDTGGVEEEFDIELGTDDTVNGVEILTPNGQILTIPYDADNWDEDTSTWTESGYYADEDMWEWEFSRGNYQGDFGDGWYIITVSYKNGGQDETRVWSKELYGDKPLPQPTQIPVPTSPADKEGNVSPSTTIRWNPCKDKNATSVWVWLEKEEEEYYEDLSQKATSWSPPEDLTDGYWEAEVSFENYYGTTNADGIEVWNGKCAWKEYEFAVGEPWAVYEVYGGNTYPTDDAWYFFSNIDQQQSYTKLGFSSGGTETFSGEYEYYVIATREEVSVDSVQGSDDSYCPDVWLEERNTYTPENITGPPDEQSAIIGYWGETEESFRGYVVIPNPGGWTDMTVLVPFISGDVSIQKCMAKAGKTADQSSLSFAGIIDITADSLGDASGIRVTVDSGDMDPPFVSDFPVNDTSLKKGKYNYARAVNASKQLFKLNTKSGKFTFAAKNVDLTGLSCPVSVKIEIGNYVAEVELDEDIVNGTKKPMPIQFMMGVKDSFKVDKTKVKFGKKTSTDSLSAKGTFTVEDVQAFQNGINNDDPIYVILGSQTFPVYPGKSAKFDTAKCTFLINLKGLDIAEYGEVDFGIDAFGINLMSIDKIDLGPKSSYGIEELRRYDALGEWWNYDSDYTVKGPGFKESGSTDGTVSVDNSTKLIDGHECSVVNVSSGGASTSTSWYTDSTGTHQTGWGFDELLGDFELTMDSLMVAPTVLRIGQQHVAQGPFEGTFDLGDPYIDITGFRGQAKSTYKLVSHEQIQVPAGSFDAVKVTTKLDLKGTMDLVYNDGPEYFETTVKFSGIVSQTWWGVPDVGVAKCATKMTIKISAKGMGSLSVTFTEIYELTNYSND